MAHKCIVAKVSEVVEIPGADRIHVAKVLGEDCIVSKEVGVGFEGLLFPADLQLSEEFCHENNLNRSSDLNKDKEKKGFFEKSRRVRVQPFLKVKSTAFFCGKESVAFTGTNLDELKLGVQFDELNGKKICQKYVSEETKVAKGNKQTQQAKKNYAPLFDKHVDSEQFKHYAHTIPKGALLSFHSKKHGCFKGDTRVRMYDGTTQAINKIKEGDSVVGYDENGNLVKSSVLKVWDNGKDETQWVNVKTSKIDGTKGNKYYSIDCTKDHLFRTVSGYNEAGELKYGDILVAAQPSYIYSDDQIAALIGMYLGDGYLSESFNMQFCHEKSFEDYIDFKLSLFGDLGGFIKKDKVSGYGSNIVFTMLKSTYHIRKLFGNCQKEKRVDPWMLEKCSPLTLAILYMDDGSLSHSDYQKDRASIACCGIKDEYINIYVAMFNKFGIYPILYKDLKGFNRLRLNREDSLAFWTLISGYIPDVMKYKFPAGWCFKDMYEFTKGVDGFIEAEVSVKDVVHMKKKYRKYDLMTETSNYVVSNIVVHNSSFRVAHTKVGVELPKWKQLVNKVVDVFPSEKWDYVVGTRNVILKPQDSNKEGFHGSEAFRFEVMEQLKPYLEKGISLYGEIVGFVNGKPIMPRHSTDALKDKKFSNKYGKEITYAYGCKEHEYKFHVYRITYLNHNNENVDFSQKQLEKWCQDRNIPYTLEVYPQMVYDGNVRELCDLLEQLTERPEVLTEDYTDPSHISEGVIVRIDDGCLTPKFMKSKSYAFRVAEGICREVDTEGAS